MSNALPRIIFVLWSAIFTTTFANYCPNGAFDYGGLGECVLAVDAPTSFDMAQATCKALGGQLIQINSETENFMAVVAAVKTLSGTQTTALIGVVNKNNQSRINADGTVLNYWRFASADEYSKPDGCTVLNFTDFNWYSASCATSNPFICAFSDQGGAQCSSGWTFNELTGKCYYLQNVLQNDSIPMYTRSTAETMCQSMGAHLASIHSDAEDIFIRNLAATSRKDEMCVDWGVVIGATCSETEGKTWTDGSPFNYDLTDGECAESYTIVNDEHCRGSLQNIWDSHDNFKYARFVCKKDPQ
ncbi:unnamed protein product, partial [Mesorhabditis belari]|uniref:C-type lectin domain-containing protein n=1 Tax=Mesorhabditis belari TaxID=2138241 RepID=A0AAF3FMH2_9BILA